MARTFEFKRAVNDPESFFASPDEVLRHEALDRDQKIEILKRWEYDASQVEVAVEEGMPNDRPSRLEEVLAALHELTGGIDVSHTPPTKQGGV